MPRRDRLGRHPHRQAAAVAQRDLVLPPVLHPVPGFRDLVTAGLVMLVRHRQIIVPGAGGRSIILLQRPTHAARCRFVHQRHRHELLASVEQIEEQAGRLSRFMADLLDRSRIESGTRAPRRDLVDVTNVVRAAAERFRKTFPAQRISISLARDLPRISGDANILARVLFKLLDNARKYSGRAGASISARHHGGDVVIIVTDQRAGGKPTDDERVSEEFSSGGRPYGPGAGTELGLSICRSLVETMGGTLVVESPALRERDTRMVMRFPIAEEP